jgi:superfamily II DNA or RNA helicase
MVTITHSWVSVDRVDEGIISACESLYTYQSPKFELQQRKHREVHPLPVPSCKLCSWDGKVRLYFVRSGELLIPTGLFMERPIDFGELRATDLRVYPPAGGYNEAYLRDYQKESVDVLIERKRGLLAAPTGSGKTHIIAALVEACPKPALVLCHTQRLLFQLREKISELLGEAVGVVGAVGAGLSDIKPITVGMVQTLFRSREKFKPFLRGVRTLVVDETHHAAARSYFWVIQTCRGCGYRFGVSATPFRTQKEEELWLVAAIGPLVHSIERSDLAERGYVAKAVAFMVRCPVKGLLQYSNDWHEVYLKHVVYNAERNKLICDAVGYLGTPAIILVWSVEHGRLLKEMLTLRGYRCEFVYGETPAALRALYQKQINEGELDVLIATDVFKEGIDFPSVRFLVNAGGFKSDLVTLQRAGRVTRPHGDLPAVIIDFYDVGGFLTKHSRERMKALRREFENVIVVESPARLTRLLQPTQDKLTH